MRTDKDDLSCQIQSPMPNYNYVSSTCFFSCEITVKKTVASPGMHDALGRYFSAMAHARSEECFEGQCIFLEEMNDLPATE